MRGGGFMGSMRECFGEISGSPRTRGMREKPNGSAITSILEAHIRFLGKSRPAVLRQSWWVGTACGDFGELSRAAVRGRLGKATLPFPGPLAPRGVSGGSIYLNLPQFSSIRFGLRR